MKQQDGGAHGADVPRGAEWLRAWRNLSLEDRRRVRKAVQRGRGCPDPTMASLALEATEHWRELWLGQLRRWLTLAGVSLAMAATTAVVEASDLLPPLLGAYAVAMTVLALQRWLWIRRSEPAQAANKEMARGA